MSCSYDVKCVTCKVSTDLDLNHGGSALMNALSHRPALEAYGRAQIAIAKGTDGWYFDTYDSSRLGSLARFLAAHEGHTLIVEDEYGRNFEACSADVICTCGHYCTLKPGHSGEHQR
jgi:hypothetical protein